ncbi:MAG: S8 family peptidase [Paludibacteraceae bacterium]|nr:S8 family peptidase [Paludibacteraceae bacterium]
MKKILFVMAVALFSTVTLVGQSKISNYTASLIESRKSNAEFHRSPMAKTVKMVNGKEYVDCYVRFVGQIDEELLNAYGAKLHCRYDFINVATAAVPIDAIEPLSENENIKRVEAGMPVSTNMDLARVASNANGAMNGAAPLTKSYLGRGVVVGVVDRDMQLNHPAFWDASHSRYRIKRFWNENGTTGVNPSQFNYGSEYTDSAKILQVKYDTRQMTSGHATHVAGIAVGADRTQNYYGIAQESDIVFVSDDNALSTGIPDGIKYCFDYAKSVGKPCVVNVSMGSTLGPHDGTSIESQIIDGLVGPGYIAVGSAGNEADGDLHTGKLLDGVNDTSYITFVSFKNNPGYQYGYAYIDVYGEPNQVYTVQLVAYNKDAKECSYMSAPLACNGSGRISIKPDTVIDSYGRLKCNMFMAAETTDNGRGHISVTFNSVDSVPKRHNIGLRVVTNNPGFVHMWSYEKYSSFTNSNQSQIVGGDASYSVGEPMGVTDGVITVGSYVTRPGSSATKEGTISNFSSRGPTSDNRVKPDITAPGEFIWSAYPDLNVIKDGRSAQTTVGGETFYYGSMKGTSMSSPYCAGVIATWLEADPTLDPDDIRDVFAHSVILDEFTGDVSDKPNNTWGMGKINDYYGLLYILGQTTKTQDVFETGVLVAYPNPTSDILNIGLPVADENVTVAIYDLSGKCVYIENLDETSAGQNVEVSVSHLASGAYIVKVSGSKMNDTFKLIKE